MTAVLVLAVLAAALLLWQRPWQGEGPVGDGIVAIPADSSAQLTTQLRELSAADSEQSFTAAAGDATFGGRTWASLEVVAAPGTSFTYISGGDVADRADGSASAVVEVQWHPAAGSGLDPAVTHQSVVDLRVAPQRDGSFAIMDATRRSGSLPLWLAGAVTVDASPGRSVVSIDGGLDAPVGQLADTARSAVERIVSDATGQLAIIAPHTQAQMAALVGQETGAVAQIAAVTTDIDGDTTTRDPVVVLNPAVFEQMDQRAAQVVLSHEATHALTPAVGTAAPNWVVEGFADYVALDDDAAPLSVSAGQILAEVAAGRVPETLPDDDAFGSTQHGLGAVYESAWMVFRMLGERYPAAKIVGFYDDVIGGTAVDEALDRSFGLTVEELTAQWRGYLTSQSA